MATVALVGVATAFFAATIGPGAERHQKVLAYSTSASSASCFSASAVGAFTAGFFHVFTHAFFKACLFLAPDR